jgi:hypothetical protein
MTDDSSWHYAPHVTLRGALQRGRGIGVLRLRDHTDPAPLVYECAGRDTRWDSQVEDRPAWVARLLRDHRLDPAPLIARLRAGEDADFDYPLEILVSLGRADEQVRDVLRAYVRDGARWMQALEALAGTWPADWWDDLWEAAAARIGTVAAHELWPDQQPWPSWHGRDPRLDAALDAAALPACLPPPGPAETPDAAVVAELRRAVGDRDRSTAILALIARQKRRVPQLLDLAEQLAPTRPHRLLDALRPLVPEALPYARRWLAEGADPLSSHAADLLAEHGDEQDVSALFGEFQRRTDHWCGYEDLAEGLARILARSPAPEISARLVRRVRRIDNATPHSYARTSHLRTLLLLDPERTAAELPVHLFDCEDDVRLLAVRHTPLTDDARHRLAELRDDPIEEEEIRHAATERLATA